MNELHIEGAEECADCGWVFEYSHLTSAEVEQAWAKHVCKSRKSGA